MHILVSIYIYIYIYTSVRLCVYTHRQQEVKLSSRCVCDVDLVESLNHKNYPQLLSHFQSKSYRQRQSHDPFSYRPRQPHRPGVGSGLLGSLGLGSRGPGSGVLESWSPGFLESWDPGIPESWTPGFLGPRPTYEIRIRSSSP